MLEYALKQERYTRNSFRSSKHSILDQNLINLNMAVKLRLLTIKNLLLTKDKLYSMMRIKTIRILHSVVVVFLSNKVDNYFDSMCLSLLVTYSTPLLSIRYLKEIGYVDNIIDIRSTAVKKLLGIKSESSVNGDIKSTNEPKKYIEGIHLPSSKDFHSRTLPTINDFPKSLASLVISQDDDENKYDITFSSRSTLSLSLSSDDDLDTNRNHGPTNHQTTLNDLDNEESALHEFDFLSGDTTATGR